MNATVQALRAIPELQTALARAPATGPGLAPALRDLYAGMARTTEPALPLAFLQALRAAAPQFAEVDRARAGKDLRSGAGPSGGLSGAAAMMGIGGGFAQQDAEEAWGAITAALKDVPGEPLPAGASGPTGFIDQFMRVEMRREYASAPPECRAHAEARAG
jgi:ubiquitin carboxyl-terminal hydrolase 14